MFIIPFLLFIVCVSGMLKIFSKAGRSPLLLLVPVYGFFVWQEITRGKKLFAWLMLVPIVNFPIWIVINIQMARVFGRGIYYGLGMALLPFVFFPALAISKQSYQPQHSKVEPRSTYLIAIAVSILFVLVSRKPFLANVFNFVNSNDYEKIYSEVEPTEILLDDYNPAVGQFEVNRVAIAMPKAFRVEQDNRKFKVIFENSVELEVYTRVVPGTLERFDTFEGNFNISEVEWQTLAKVSNENELYAFVVNLTPKDAPLFQSAKTRSLYRTSFLLKDSFLGKVSGNIFSFKFGNNFGYQLGIPGQNSWLMLSVMSPQNKRIDIEIFDTNKNGLTQRDLNTMIRSVAEVL